MELQLAVLAILLNTISAQISPDFNELLDRKLNGSPSNTPVQGASATAKANVFSSPSLSDYSSPSTYSKQLANALSFSQQNGGYPSAGRGGEIIIHKPSPIIVRRPPTKVLVNHPPLIVRPAPVIFHRPPAVVVRPVVIHHKPAAPVQKPAPPQPGPYVPPSVSHQPYLPCPPPAFGNPLLALLAGSLLTPQPSMSNAPYSLPLMPQVPYAPPPPYLPTSSNYYPPQAQQYPSSGFYPSASASSASAATSSGTNTVAASSSANSASSSLQTPSINDMRPEEYFPSNSIGGSSGSYDDQYY